MGAWSSATPVRAASWWYVGQSPAGAGDRAVTDVDAGTVVVGDEDEEVDFDDEEQAASTSATAAVAMTSRLI